MIFSRCGARVSSPIEDFVIEELAEIEDQRTVEEKIDSGIADGRIGPEDSGDILREWRRINKLG